MEQVKQDLSRKEAEMLGLQTKLETLNNQFSDSKQHIEVLKESLTAKEQRAAILQTEVQQKRFYPLVPTRFSNSNSFIYFFIYSPWTIPTELMLHAKGLTKLNKFV